MLDVSGLLTMDNGVRKSSMTDVRSTCRAGVTVDSTPGREQRPVTDLDRSLSNDSAWVTPMISASAQSTPTVDSTMNNSTSTTSSSNRIPLPSPQRPRLDPQYAARLPQQNRSGNSSLIQPPPINRKYSTSSIFRSTPFITPVKRTYSSGSGSFASSDSPERTTARTFSHSSVSSSNSAGRSQNSLLTPRRYTTRYRSDVGQSDRFIPSRATSNFTSFPWNDSSGNASTGGTGRNLTSEGTNESDGNQSNIGDRSNGDNNGTNPQASRSPDTNSNSHQSMLNVLLRSELLGENIDPSAPNNVAVPYQNRGSRGEPLREGGNHYQFQSPRQAYHRSVLEQNSTANAVVNGFNLSPVGSVASQRLMSTPQKRKRRIQKVPFKVLDAPALQDDFYLNLVDWSSQNVLAVGLGSCVYLWSACTSKVTKLCDLAQAEDIVTSVAWAQRGNHLAVGTNRGEVQLWDTIKCKKVRTMGGHSARIGTLSWTGPSLASGSRDRLIYLRDVRVQPQYTHRLCAHKQEVCGLKWSFDEPAMLASGGNDNKLLVWDIKNSSQPMSKFSEHSAAVKAIAWSPHQHGLLASGGGTADRCIRFWNTLSGVGLHHIDTGSQVCNLAWSKNCNEIVSTHGYSLNQIVVWRYPSMSKVTTLTGHTFRVLYLAMSPDGSTIVT